MTVARVWVTVHATARRFGAGLCLVDNRDTVSVNRQFDGVQLGAPGVIEQGTLPGRMGREQRNSPPIALRADQGILADAPMDGRRHADLLCGTNRPRRRARRLRAPPGQRRNVPAGSRCRRRPARRDRLVLDHVVYRRHPLLRLSGRWATGLRRRFGVTGELAPDLRRTRPPISAGETLEAPMRLLLKQERQRATVVRSSEVQFQSGLIRIQCTGSSGGRQRHVGGAGRGHRSRHRSELFGMATCAPPFRLGR